MSILKRSREASIGNFRKAVSITGVSPHTQEIEIDENINLEKKSQNTREKYLEEQAERIEEKRKVGRPRRKDRLDVRSRRISITVSPREEALFRDCANREDRALSEWVRRAVKAYIKGEI